MSEYDFITEEEEGDLKKWVPRVIEDFRKKGVKNIVALDGSGRPVGLLVWKTWKKLYPNEKPKLFFINPDFLRDASSILRARHLSEEEVKWRANFLLKNKIFQKEHPHLFKAIKENPSSVGIVDELIRSGRTVRGVKALFKEISKKEDFPVHSFKDNKSKGGYLVSWFHDPSLIGVSTAFHSLTAEEPTLVSEKEHLTKSEKRNFLKFRKELIDLANKIAENQRAKLLNQQYKKLNGKSIQRNKRRRV